MIHVLMFNFEGNERLRKHVISSRGLTIVNNTKENDSSLVRVHDISYPKFNSILIMVIKTGLLI